MAVEIIHPNLTNPIQGDPLDYMLAGKAIVTIVNQETKKHLTYSIYQGSKPHRDRFKYPVWFVKAMVRTQFFSYMGIIIPRELYFTTTSGSRLGTDTQHVRVFIWLMQQLRKRTLPEQIVVYHSGSCGKCHKTLTNPLSLKRGVGPWCYKIIQTMRRDLRGGTLLDRLPNEELT